MYKKLLTTLLTILCVSGFSQQKYDALSSHQTHIEILTTLITGKIKCHMQLIGNKMCTTI